MVEVYSRDTNNIRLRKNFSLHEFFCNCGKCHNQLINPMLVGKLQLLRSIVGPIHITNAFRCENHNADVGGVPNSQHPKGNAADIVVPGMSPKEVAEQAEKAGFDGIGVYSNFTHVDVRGNKARWNG